MIKKLTALVLSGILTVGLVAASSPSVELKTEASARDELIAVMAQDCRDSYRAYQSGNDDLQGTINKYPAELRDMVYAVCVGYTYGYYDAGRTTNA